MNSWHVMGWSFLSIFGCSMAGYLLRSLMREHQLSDPTREVVKLTAGVVASMTALVLGLLVASTKQSYDSKVGEIRTFVTNITLMDRSMRHYVPSLAPEREALAGFTQAMIDQLWTPNAPDVDVLGFLDKVRDRVRNLEPPTDALKFQQIRILDLSNVLMLTSNQLLSGDDAEIPVPLLVVVVVWLSAIFLGFGLFAPVNLPSIVALAIGAGAISMSVFLIVEMSGPFDGLIRISPHAMEHALAAIKAP